MAKAPRKAEREHMQEVAELGCIICGAPACVHHALTGMGGRKDHMKVIPLCHHHHQGKEGIHFMGRKAWQRKYGFEEDMLKEVQKKLEDNNDNYIL